MSNKITKTLCPESKRLDFLPKHIGKKMLQFEATVYGYMDSFAESYTGGYWEFYTLSNGGFYMSLSQEAPLHLVQNTNHFNDEMSADAASIGINLYAIYSLLEEASNSNNKEELKRFQLAYHHLKEFAYQHEEASKILRLID
ncbi:antirestriction protein [Aquimarina aggregata]|uniref:antirestriction protein n=1 Tax=Aquimarina aggregata TaxID=1642818 RepID=UPI0024908818|nr:antirestriction protein [Aquimarina aggregata]